MFFFKFKELSYIRSFRQSYKTWNLKPLKLELLEIENFEIPQVLKSKSFLHVHLKFKNKLTGNLIQCFSKYLQSGLKAHFSLTKMKFI